MREFTEIGADWNIFRYSNRDNFIFVTDSHTHILFS